MGKLHALADGKPDWGAVFSWGGEVEDGPPRAPKRAGSSTFDYWFENCGHVVAASDPVLSQLSTDWTKDLRRWTREAERAHWRNALILRLGLALTELDQLSKRLAKTPAGKLAHKRRKIAEMNARYTYKGGKWKYVGKKTTDARKAKRAEAARARRAVERNQTHAPDFSEKTRLH